MKTALLPCLLFITAGFLASCATENPGPNVNDPCASIAGVHTQPFTPVTKGDPIQLHADFLDGASYTWNGPGGYSSYSQNPDVSSYASYWDEGWYYLRVDLGLCDPVFDSVYVDVKFPQGTPACSPANNTAEFTSAVLLGDQAFSFLSWGTVSGGFGAVCNSSNGDLTVTFNSYWQTHDLEDGIYYTSSNNFPDERDGVFMSDVNQSIYWVAEPNKPVYVSHVGGKQRVTFCGIDFSGTWGSSLYHASVDCQITQP